MISLDENRKRNFKGIILAGGLGSRLDPLTRSVSKHLLPVYDKPMIYYPLTTLMSLGISNIAIITKPEDERQYYELFGNGERLGLHIEYIVQQHPEGLPQSFILAEEFLSGSPSTLILGDNIFINFDMDNINQNLNDKNSFAKVLTCKVRDPERYGVLQFDGLGNCVDIFEKPVIPPSDQAVTGLYFFDQNAPLYAKMLTPSERGEYEIVDLLRRYLLDGTMRYESLEISGTWLDAGTIDSLLRAALLVKGIQERNGVLIGSPELQSLKNNWISQSELQTQLSTAPNNSYYNELRLKIGQLNDSD